jgi:peroxiredoxin
MTASFPHLLPRRRVPNLRVPLVGGGTYDIRKETPALFSLIVFYRGLHCPICRVQLKELEAKLGEFERCGVSVVAISSDADERAVQTKREWQLLRLRIGYGLSLPAAREWGLYISSGRGKTSIGVEEPARFAEPAIYLVRPDGTLYFGSVQTMPFARPHFSDILGAIDYVVKNDYPARGEVDAIFETATAE